MSTYDQWKASDPAGDDADVRDGTRGMTEAEIVALHDAVVAAVEATPDADVVAVKMVKCRACGADFPNPYGGGVDAALCDGCLQKPMEVKKGVFE